MRCGTTPLDKSVLRVSPSEITRLETQAAAHARSVELSEVN